MMLDALVLDCANGVGGDVFKKIYDLVKKSGHGLSQWRVSIRNAFDAGLNDHVGAEYVQKTKSLPRSFARDDDKGKKLASFDGDADRVVYYYLNSKGFHLLDGDKIIALFALFIRDLLIASGLRSLQVGIVQTAYANGASTIYMQAALNMPVECTPTGVKYLHAKVTIITTLNVRRAVANIAHVPHFA